MPRSNPKRAVSDADLLAFDPCAGDRDSEPGERRMPPRLVVVRKQHECRMTATAHPIEIGTRAVVYTRIMPRAGYQSFYLCCACVEREVLRWL